MHTAVKLHKAVRVAVITRWMWQLHMYHSVVGFNLIHY